MFNKLIKKKSLISTNLNKQKIKVRRSLTQDRKVSFLDNFV